MDTHENFAFPFFFIGFWKKAFRTLFLWGSVVAFYCPTQWRHFFLAKEFCFLIRTLQSLTFKQIQTLQGLKLYLDYSGAHGRRRATGSGDLDYANADAWASAYSAVAAGAALVAGLGVLAFLRRST